MAFEHFAYFLVGGIFQKGLCAQTQLNVYHSSSQRINFIFIYILTKYNPIVCPQIYVRYRVAALRYKIQWFLTYRMDQSNKQNTKNEGYINRYSQDGIFLHYFGNSIQKQHKFLSWFSYRKSGKSHPQWPEPYQYQQQSGID